MIVKEFYRTRKDEVNLYRTYSDQNLMIQKVGTDEVYAEAIDVEGCGCEYTETDTPIETEENTATDDIVEKAKAYDILMGVSE